MSGQTNEINLNEIDVDTYDFTKHFMMLRSVSELRILLEYNIMLENFEICILIRDVIKKRLKI